MSGEDKGCDSAVYAAGITCEHRFCEVRIENPARGQKFCSQFCKNAEWAAVREDGKAKKKRGEKHFATLRSKKLQKMLNHIKNGMTYTSIELSMFDPAFNQTIQALRHRGYNIPSKFWRTTENGGKVFVYQLIEER